MRAFFSIIEIVIFIHCTVNTIAIEWTLGELRGNQKIYKIDNLCTFIMFAFMKNANNGRIKKRREKKRKGIEMQDSGRRQSEINMGESGGRAA